MRINSLIQDQIKQLCLKAEVEHYKVLPYVKQFYEGLNESQVFPREILNTAKNKIAELKHEPGVNDSTMLNERDSIITFNKNTRHA